MSVKGLSMALLPCALCRQPFYASCHDGSCAGAPLCPWYEYEDDDPSPDDGAVPPRGIAHGVAAEPLAQIRRAAAPVGWEDKC